MSEQNTRPGPGSALPWRWRWRAALLRSSPCILGLLIVVAAGPASSEPVILHTIVGSTMKCTDEGLDSASCRAVDAERHRDGQVSRQETALAARAAVGSLGVEGLVVADSTSSRDYFTGVTSNANASFRDTLTITAPGLEGTAGTISFRLLVDGGFAGSAPATVRGCTVASWFFVIRADDGEGGAASVFDSTRGEDGTCTPGGPLELLTSVDVIGAPLRFTFGTPFSLDGEMGLSLDTYSDGGQYSFLSATFLHTGALGGLAGLRDASGRLVDDFSITAASGADYTRSFGTSSVPLPSTIWLVAIGLAGLARRRRG